MLMMQKVERFCLRNAVLSEHDGWNTSWKGIDRRERSPCSFVLQECLSMANVQDLLNRKGTEVECIGAEATVFDAAERMNARKIGSLVVLDGDLPVGIVTERDILQRVVAARLPPDDTSVADVMTRELICCQSNTTVDEARGVMKNRRIRHMPVVSVDGRLVGLISIGDLNAHENHHTELTIHLLEAYIAGHA